ncbi:hypothetical protein STAFG_4732 [Streptomyces afghaniensis 772]|uniref:Uncharacterized protein n=1 Tax=Streptomyces afghaniensis 772 TaxID=1283301 RepID=S4MWM1_9ACTN|nr:hypothetical protein STAFG_4732 [Streptomyces afghaniensis 772]
MRTPAGAGACHRGVQGVRRPGRKGSAWRGRTRRTPDGRTPGTPWADVLADRRLSGPVRPPAWR